MSLIKHSGEKKVKGWNVDSDRQLRANFVIAMQRENDIIAMILEGKPNDEIKTYICSKYNLAISTAATRVSECHQKVRERRKWELDALIDTHVQRYEVLYNKLYELGAKGAAVQALQAKEKLLGLHKNGTHFRVNNQELTTISLQDVKADYDFSKLGEQERLRLQELLGKLQER